MIFVAVHAWVDDFIARAIRAEEARGGTGRGAGIANHGHHRTGAGGERHGDSTAQDNEPTDNRPATGQCGVDGFADQPSFARVVDDLVGELCRRDVFLCLAHNDALGQDAADRLEFAQGDNVEVGVDIHHAGADDSGVGVDGGE
jgi:hypothetical protein